MELLKNDCSSLYVLCPVKTCYVPNELFYVPKELCPFTIVINLPFGIYLRMRKESMIYV